MNHRDELKTYEELKAYLDTIKKPNASQWPALPEEEELEKIANPFPTKILPKILREYCEAVSVSMGTDSAFAGLGILGACATAIGASTRLEVKPGWFEYASLWLALCSRPGTAKSPSLNATFEPIRNIQSELTSAYKQALKTYEGEKAQARKDPSADLPTKPLPKFILLNDTTCEALIKALSESPKGGALVSDELTSWLGSHDKYTGKGNDRQSYLKLWSSLSTSVLRKADGLTTVKLPVLTVVGGLTPSSLPKLHGGQEDGFLNRILIACPPERKSKYTKQGISPIAQSEYAVFIRKLWQLEPDGQDDESYLPKTVTLSEEAEEAFEQFYNEMQTELEGETLPSLLRGTWSKAPTQLGRIALVLHCCKQVAGEEDDPHRLSPDTMKGAILLVRYFLNESKKIAGEFEPIGTRSEKQKDKILDALKGHYQEAIDVFRTPEQFAIYTACNPANYLDLKHRARVPFTRFDGTVNDQVFMDALEYLEAKDLVLLIQREHPKRKHLKPAIEVNPYLLFKWRKKKRKSGFPVEAMLPGWP